MKIVKKKLFNIKSCKLVKKYFVKKMGLKHWILQSWMLLTVIVCGKGQVYQHTPITEKIPLGAIFEQGTDDVQSAFKYAMLHHNNNKSESRRFELQAYVDVINTADAFKLSRLSKIFSYIYIYIYFQILFDFRE